jgi:hypothetical protein
MLAGDGRRPTSPGVLRPTDGEVQGDLPPQRRHHLDYAHYRLGESFHNPGFFQRESSLLRLLAAPAEEPVANGAAPPPEIRPAEPASDTTPATPVQLRLPAL